MKECLHHTNLFYTGPLIYIYIYEHCGCYVDFFGFLYPTILQFLTKTYLCQFVVSGTCRQTEMVEAGRIGGSLIIVGAAVGSHAIGVAAVSI